MKRNLDLIRDMLLRIEDISNGSKFINIQDFTDLNSDPTIISYHLALLVDAGLVGCEGSAYIDNIKDYDITRLTMYGCDYLDSIRNTGTWHSIKEKLKTISGNATMDIIETLAITAMKSKLGI